LIKKYIKQLRGSPITLFNTCISSKTRSLLPINTNDTLIVHIHVSDNLDKTFRNMQFFGHILPQCVTIYAIIGLVQVNKYQPKRGLGADTVLH
jgi:hypothetical protein